MIEAIVFDIDGTLLDHDGAQRAGLIQLYETLEEVQCVSPGEFVAIWQRENERYWELYQAGEISFPQQRILRVRAVFDHLGEYLTEEQAMTIFYIYLAAFERNWRLYDDVLPCLDSLSAYPLAVVSNGDSGQQRRKLERMGILSRFSSVVISGDLGISKPHPDIFASSLRELNVLAGEAVYVGDDFESDALGAHDAGMNAVWLARQGHSGDPATLPVRVIGSLSQVQEVLNEL